jgi:hypothetical protein
MFYFCHKIFMISKGLKHNWRDATIALAERDIANPKTDTIFRATNSAFSGYLSRLFSRESLTHVTDDNVKANKGYIMGEIQKDIDANKPSTGSVARYIKAAYETVFKQPK